jgi:outer membrane protein TolC
MITVFTALAQQNNLQFYLDSGLEASPLLKDYQNQIRTNAIDSAKIRAGYKPQVMASSTNSYAPVINGWGYDEAITNGRNINAVVGVSKVFVGRRNIQSQFETISLLNLGLENTKKITEQDLKRTITAQYITTYGDKQQYEFLDESFRLLKDEDEVLKKLTQNNVYRQTDYLTFLVTLQQQDIARSQSLIQLQNDLATLNYLCGIVDTMQVDLMEPIVSLTQYPAPGQSVFFQQYRIDSLSLINKRLLVDFNYRPKLSAFADAGSNSSLAITPYKNLGYNFGFTLSVPIYDGHQRKMEYKKLDLAEQTRSNYQDFFNHQYNQQMIQYRQQLRSTEDLIIQINDQMKYSEALIKAHTRLLSTGDVKIADLVIAVNNYLTVRNQLMQNKIARWQIINQMNYWNR